MPDDGVSRANSGMRQRAKSRGRIHFWHNNRERWVAVNDLRGIIRAMDAGRSFEPSVPARLVGQNRGPAEMVHYKTVMEEYCRDKGVPAECFWECLDHQKPKRSSSRSRSVDSEGADQYVMCRVDGVLFFARVTTELLIRMYRLFGHFHGEVEDDCVCFETVVFSSLEDCQAAGIIGPVPGRVIVLQYEEQKPVAQIAATKPDTESLVWAE